LTIRSYLQEVEKIFDVPAHDLTVHAVPSGLLGLKKDHQ